MSNIIEIKVPSVGESIMEVTIAEWLKEDGESLSINEAIVSLETDKANVDVVAEKAGRLEIVAQAGDTLAIGALLGKIHVGKEGKKKVEKEKPSEEKPKEETVSVKESKAAEAVNLEELSPAVRRIVAEKTSTQKQLPEQVKQEE